MKKIIILLFSLFVISCHSQTSVTIVQAIQNDSLPIVTTGGMNGGCLFLERPLYYINEKYVIYQDCQTRKILYADVSTFKIVKYYGQYGLALDKNGIYVKGNFVATDTTGFTFLGINNKDLLWKTNTSVYKNTTLLPQISAKEFIRLPDQNRENYSGIYFKDNANIYYFDKKINGADLATADLVDNDSQMFYDKNHLYKDGAIVTFGGEPVLHVNNFLNKTATKVLFQGKAIPNIDAKTLVGLSRNYAKDKNNIYGIDYTKGVMTLPINKADFNNIKVWDHTNSAYITDGKSLFYQNYIFAKKELDVATFGTFGFTDFVYDKNGVYKRLYDKKLEKVVYDKFPFKYTDPVNSRNVQITAGSSLYVYYNNQAYEESTNTLYENVTPQQIETSKNRAHTPNMIRLAKFDGKTVLKTTFDYNLYKAGHAVYYDTKKTSADAETFEKIDYNYYKDKNNVYIYNREKGLLVLNSINAKSVKNFNGFIVDGSYLYIGETRVINSQEIEILASYPGYRLGCGLDQTPSADFYLFKNTEGFWWVKVSNEITIRFLGPTLKKELSPLFENLELPE